MSGTMMLKPGLLVAFSARIEGGVSYQRTLKSQERTGEGRLTEEWETVKIVTDEAEYKQAQEKRSKLGSLVRSCCVNTAFGLLCTGEENAAKLEGNFRAAVTLAKLFNAQARTCSVNIRMLRGSIAADDAEAARAIAAEIRDLLDSMAKAVKAGDKDAIREAASRARQMNQVVGNPVASEAVEKAIAQARSIAREIVKRVEKQGEAIATVIREQSTSQIEAARFAFLDTSDSVPVAGEALPTVNLQRFAGIDDSPVNEGEEEVSGEVENQILALLFMAQGMQRRLAGSEVENA